jgi:nucleoside-diphosphate-sugar epimerase
LARNAVDAGDRLSFIAADLGKDEGWDEAVGGCRYVLHVASPLPRTQPKHEDELIIPARDGTLRVLRAASEAGVARVVQTSSVAAVMYGRSQRDGSRTFDESDWSDIAKIGFYPKSKTIAERAAWEFIEGLNGEEGREYKLELTVINPGLVMGPLMSANFSTSGEVVKRLMKRELPGCPPLGWAPVDVRDVADAHVAAMTNPEAAGKRFVCAIEHAWMQDVARVLDRHFAGKGYKIPTGKLPGFVLRLVAIFDKTVRLATDSLNLREDLSNARIKEVLGWQPRSLEEMVVAMAESMIEHGVV